MFTRSAHEIAIALKIRTKNCSEIKSNPLKKKQKNEALRSTGVGGIFFILHFFTLAKKRKSVCFFFLSSFHLSILNVPI